MRSPGSIPKISERTVEELTQFTEDRTVYETEIGEQVSSQQWFESHRLVRISSLIEQTMSSSYFESGQKQLINSLNQQLQANQSTKQLYSPTRWRFCICRYLASVRPVPPLLPKTFSQPPTLVAAPDPRFERRAGVLVVVLG